MEKIKTEVLGREFEGGPFFKRVSLNNEYIAYIKHYGQVPFKFYHKCQMLCAYSVTARSAENIPAPAILFSDIFAHFILSL